MQKLVVVVAAVSCILGSVAGVDLGASQPQLLKTSVASDCNGQWPYPDEPGPSSWRDPCDLVLEGTAPTMFHHQAPFKVVAGLLSELRADGDFTRATCLGVFDETPSPDPSSDPLAGDGRYYLAQGATCPGYGSSSLDPDPRSDLEFNDPCPFICPFQVPGDLAGTWHYCEDCDKTGFQPQSCIEFNGDSTLVFILPTEECCDCPGTSCVNNLSFGAWGLDPVACTVHMVIDTLQIPDPNACWVEPLDVTGTVVEYDGNTLVLDFGGPTLTLARDMSTLPCYCQSP